MWTSSPMRERAATSPSPSSLGELQYPLSAVARCTILCALLLSHQTEGIKDQRLRNADAMKCFLPLSKSTCVVFVFSIHSDAGHMLEMIK